MLIPIARLVFLTVFPTKSIVAGPMLHADMQCCCSAVPRSNNTRHLSEEDQQKAAQKAALQLRNEMRRLPEVLRRKWSIVTADSSASSHSPDDRAHHIRYDFHQQPI